jgi:hypothetical protein
MGLGGVGDLLKTSAQLVKNSPVGSVLETPGSAGVELFGTNVPLWPLINYRDHFLRLLETWSGSIPLQFQWLVMIERFPTALYSDLLQQLEPGRDGEKKGWNIKKNVTTTTSYANQKIAGCIFAQGLNIPGEQMSGLDYVQPEGGAKRGFVGGLKGGDRAPFSPLTMEFLETNTSFADFVIRPWIILGSHLGLVARPSDNDAEGILDPQNVKTNITVIQLAKTYQKRSTVPRKTWRFYDCVPMQINDNNLPYDGNEVKRYDVQWRFSDYSVEGMPFIPIEEIIKGFGTGQLLNIMNGATQLGVLGNKKQASASDSIAAARRGAKNTA